MLERFKM